MTRKCVTHHNACDCREAEHLLQIEKRDREIDELKAEIKRLEVIVYPYGGDLASECNGIPLMQGKDY
jgi:hypothetical protein